VNFTTAFQKLLGHEGGYSDHRDDPGGKTRYGVTETVARAKGYTGDMRDLPIEFARDRVYRPDYWDAVQAENLPADIRYAVFDAAVNSGVAQAAKWLQRACGVKDDGVVGPLTIRAANALHPDGLKRKMLAQRLRFMATLPNWPAFGRGWANRISDLLET
jgi:lysozyme family protein